MKDLFANLYNKVFSFFHQNDSQNEASKNMACNRLKLVLMQDRTNLSPAIMDRMRKELIDLLSKYLELDRELLELNFEQEDNQMALMLSIPVIRAKDEDEIQEILRQEDEANKDTSEEEEEEETETDNEDSAKDDESETNVTDEDNGEEKKDETKSNEKTENKEEPSETEVTENSEEENKEDDKTSETKQEKKKVKKENDDE